MPDKSSEGELRAANSRSTESWSHELRATNESTRSEFTLTSRSTVHSANGAKRFDSLSLYQRAWHVTDQFALSLLRHLPRRSAAGGGGGGGDFALPMSVGIAGTGGLSLRISCHTPGSTLRLTAEIGR